MKRLCVSLALLAYLGLAGASQSKTPPIAATGPLVVGKSFTLVPTTEWLDRQLGVLVQRVKIGNRTCVIATSPYSSGIAMVCWRNR